LGELQIVRGDGLRVGPENTGHKKEGDEFYDAHMMRCEM